ncbi:DUF1918 domain-containing protein [Kribbella sp. NBC_01245]|uniref:DUF1918 domain-containing protein n=1 Tax=Kribbella sp. NBC_01245 TaxID=2903578 RepID=UPI002E2A5150|nr:DUF1918 domain-containing protein [Kribbella sp. NBC_01245]
MHAEVGDQLHVRGRTVGVKERHCEVLEVRGENGAPPYWVRYSDGHEALIFPGTDCLVEHHQS